MGARGWLNGLTLFSSMSPNRVGFALHFSSSATSCTFLLLRRIFSSLRFWVSCSSTAFFLLYSTLFRTISFDCFRRLEKLSLILSSSEGNEDAQCQRMRVDGGSYEAEWA